jgi:hypothetical protein
LFFINETLEHDKANNHAPDGKRLYGMWKGVRVGVIKTNGQIGTIFPDSK